MKHIRMGLHALFTVLILVATPALAQSSLTPQEQAHLEAFDDFDFRVFKGEKWDELSLSHSEDVIVHWPDGRTTEGLDVHIDDLAALFVWAPDTRISEHPISIAMDNYTNVVGVFEGTFTEPMPLPDGSTLEPTGQAFKLLMSTVGRWENDVMVELWLFWDNGLFTEQLGLVE